MKRHVLLLAIGALLIQCTPQEAVIYTLPSVTTGEITAITTTTATCSNNKVTLQLGIVAALTVRGVCWNTTGNPTTEDSKTEDGVVAETFTGNLTGLTPNTTYYVRAYATNFSGTAYGEQKKFTSAIEYGSFTDPRDDHVYKTVTIGEQVWMAENLAYLPSVVGWATGSEDEGNESNSYYYVYGYDGTDVAAAKAYEDGGQNNYQTYGVLYNWNAAMNGQESTEANPSVQCVCPDGWHLPNHPEWQQLTDYLGGDSVAGDIMKENNCFPPTWFFPNTGATNDSGFTARAGGGRDPYSFSGLMESGTWWVASLYPLYPYNEMASLSYDSHEASVWFAYFKEVGYSVRCVKD